LPDSSGLDILLRLKETNPDTLVIMVTGISDLNVAIGCIRQGAYDYITKPINIDELFSCTKRAIETTNLQTQLKDYQHHLEEKIEEQSEEISRISLGAISSCLLHWNLKLAILPFTPGVG
jgi:putative two-component system response regulator